MIPFVKKYPLATVLVIALAVRLLAVYWSEGFVHSDDHFDSIAVAWDWLNGGLWGPDGYLRWKHMPSTTIGRFPLYTLSLLGMMELYKLCGVDSLNTMMYGVRLSHALISLLPVWVVFRVTRMTTGSDRWALFGGLAVALHFAFPFLGVRNLIEVVGGNIWILAILLLYFYQRDRETRWLYLAGLVTGLAWMIRFQIAFAVLPIPFILWYEARRIKPAVHYSLAVAIMLLASGFLDLALLGRFAGSTLTNLSMNTSLDALYHTIPALYPTLLLLIFVPPFSVIAFWQAGRISFWRHHKLLVFSSMSFVIFHWLHSNQQERFIFPVLPAFALILILGLWYRYRERGYIMKNRKLFRWLAGVSIGLNFVLLAGLTFAFGHKGMIEPLDYFEREDPEARVMVVQPEVKRWMPIEYGGERLKHIYIRGWDDLQNFEAGTPAGDVFDYLIIYPKRAEKLQAYLDSVQVRFGKMQLLFKVAPSGYDQLLHLANSNHNDNFAAWVYEPADAEETSAVGPE